MTRDDTMDCLLILNVGSSSVKFQLLRKKPEMARLAGGKIYNLGSKPAFTGDAEHLAASDKQPLPTHYQYDDALQFILDWINQKNSAWHITVVTHRIVHGGATYASAVTLTPEVIDELTQLIPLAPLHQPQSLACVHIMAALKPNIIQIACFDTAFHANHTPLFTEYALPKNVRERGVRRYGFHGLSYAWIVNFLHIHNPSLARGRLIAAHLGNGASLCAIAHGVSMDTTMGMTALDGLVMGTRSGHLDPGVIIHMIRNLGFSLDETEAILYNKSGLLGLSELTQDVALLQTSTEPRARFALDYFCLRAAQLMGMMAVALGGVDGVVFTGGIGENSAFVRENILKHLSVFSPFETCVVPCNEEWIMAMQTQHVSGW